MRGELVSPVALPPRKARRELPGSVVPAIAIHSALADLPSSAARSFSRFLKEFGKKDATAPKSLHLFYFGKRCDQNLVRDTRFACGVRGARVAAIRWPSATCGAWTLPVCSRERNL